MKLLVISGSFRTGSYNTALCRTIKLICEQKKWAEAEVYTLENIPMFSQDLEKPADPPVVQELRQKVSAADALIISTPEYDHMIPGALKNMFDWLSRKRNNIKILANKPTAIVGASDGGFGTVRAQNQMLLLGLILRMKVSADWKFPVSSAQDKFDEHGNLTDDRTNEKLTSFLQSFIESL